MLHQKNETPIKKKKKKKATTKKPYKAMTSKNIKDQVKRKDKKMHKDMKQSKQRKIVVQTTT